ncbi:hypothetical protein MXD62_19575 [Frankia sp. Mgl5]|uniref:hypothetical protein n=1 Tax=Frankia sp. Mgl5 TaxID=2933793 RepID=UPI00200DFB8F|nr:hypothetical protein [Frankia sp. Mgl5]MCK9929353.1 hypothetical protein [Frankia sp. Mgl5]
MAELRVEGVRTYTDTSTGELTAAEITIQWSAITPGDPQGHRVSPDEIPADVRRALLRWLGHVPETEAERRA